MRTLTRFDFFLESSLIRDFVTNLRSLTTVGIVLCAFMFSSSPANAQEINWYPDVASATKAAAEQNKLVMLHFTAEWCTPCRTLHTFVYRSPGVQRAFDQNVIAVKIDVDTNTHLVEEYGVSSVPYDVAVTPEGRVVSKRKSPKDSAGYEKMVADFSLIISGIAQGESPALNQSLAELQDLVQTREPKFEGRPASFTPDAPSYQAPQPSTHSAELKRRFITNPYTVESEQQQAPPQRVANAFSPVQELNAPATISNPSNEFVPDSSFGPSGDFAPSGQFAPSSTQSPMANVDQPPQVTPRQQTQINPFVTQQVPPRNLALQRLEQSDVAAKLIREKAQQKLDAFHADPKIVMDDKFFGKPSAMQVQQGIPAGNYQAKINLPKSNDFLPPDPPSFTGEVDARIVLDAPLSNQADENQFVKPQTKANLASTSKIISSSAGVDNPIETGLDMAATKTTTPKYALHGKCPVTLLTKTKWVDGDPKWGCVHRNRIYIFTTEQNLKAFQSDPDAYSPVLAGYDPVVFQETGRLVDGLEKHGVFMGKPPHQRIVLFATAETRARFQSEPKKYLEAVRQAMQTTGASSELLR